MHSLCGVLCLLSDNLYRFLAQGKNFLRQIYNSFCCVYDGVYFFNMCELSGFLCDYVWIVWILAGMMVGRMELWECCFAWDVCRFVLIFDCFVWFCVLIYVCFAWNVNNYVDNFVENVDNFVENVDNFFNLILKWYHFDIIKIRTYVHIKILSILYHYFDIVNSIISQTYVLFFGSYT